MKLRAVSTLYKDQLFRSRIEAQWAFFLDRLHIPWAYEPQVYTFEDGSKYIPDFFLPDQNSFLEVKGSPLSGYDFRKLSNLVEFLDIPVYLVDKNPCIGDFTLMFLAETGGRLELTQHRTPLYDFLQIGEDPAHLVLAKEAKNAFRFSPTNEVVPNELTLIYPNPGLLDQVASVPGYQS